MKIRFVLASMALVLLAGCQTASTAINAYNYLTGITISQSQMDVAVAAYDVAVLTPYDTYRYSDAAFTVPRRYCTTAEPFALTNPCANFSILSRLQPYIAKAETARANLQACVATQCSGVSALVAAFKSAWATAQTNVTAQVKKGV